MLVWHLSPGYVKIRQQYAQYMNYVDAMDMLAYILTVFFHVGLTSPQFAIGVVLYALAKLNRMVY